MKTIQNSIRKFTALLLSVLFSLAIFAQDKTDVNLNVNKGGNWYTQPWVWIVGGAVFILLLVALLRGNRSKD